MPATNSPFLTFCRIKLTKQYKPPTIWQLESWIQYLATTFFLLYNTAVDFARLWRFMFLNYCCGVVVLFHSADYVERNSCSRCVKEQMFYQMICSVLHVYIVVDLLEEDILKSKSLLLAFTACLMVESHIGQQWTLGARQT